jgi:hypothetical protein
MYLSVGEEWRNVYRFHSEHSVFSTTAALRLLSKENEGRHQQREEEAAPHHRKPTKHPLHLHKGEGVISTNLCPEIQFAGVASVPAKTTARTTPSCGSHGRRAKELGGS